jgi:hypothetical protein
MGRRAACMGSARASRAVPCAPRGTPGVHRHSERRGWPGVFREGAEYGTRGACAPHARQPAFSALIPSLHISERSYQSYCAVRPGRGGRARIGPPEALGASGETAEGCPVGARRAGASESLWPLKPSATSPEAETFPRLLNPKPNPPAAPGNAPSGQTQAPTKNKQSNSVHPTSILSPYIGVRPCGNL